MSDERLEALLQFFSALSDESRLAIAGALALRTATVDELVEHSGLRRQDVVRHLGVLASAGVVEAEPDDRTRWRLAIQQMRDQRRSLLARKSAPPSGVPADASEQERRVLATFFDGEQLKEIPVGREKKLIVLRWLANRFEDGTRYDEREVNAIIKRHHADAATLRREMIDHGLMQRESGVYWRTAETPQNG
ncbi:MAG: DUF2087 domain-containing protein [Thermomicrobiales bacterium]|nr:DUF2087 domain-containing protein [Thermomicrobiales bacterium]